MTTQPQSKPLKVWYLVLISLIPFVGYYSFYKLKKVRRIFLVNLPLGIMGFLMILFINQTIGQMMNYTLLPSVDAFFVWYWARQYNQKILNT